ncbi:SagB family peptide dehydrogenase [Ornithinimicrobium faecis]|uniref:SagB family peptide dehydrogenase n=1 Tax=Ornithinimicrobium faecis TaxID=2934158 RepID=UPI002119A13F|nr:SagB family peptide dehydrogenase [Ornithinimicrobium sp. HY1745]
MSTTTSTTTSAVHGTDNSTAPYAVARHLLAVRQSCRLAVGQDPGTLSVTTPLWAQPIRLGDPAVIDAVQSLQAEPRELSELMLEVTRGSGGMTRAGLLQAVIGKLQQVGVLDHVLLDPDGAELARLTGKGPLPVTLARTAPETGRLSPLAVITVEDGRATIQSGLSHLQVVLDPSVLAVLVGGGLLDQSAYGSAVARFLESAALWEVEPATDREHRQWSAAELWVHRLSHESGSSDAYGGTYHLGEDFEPLDYVREAAERSLELPTPDLAALRASDLPLADVVERRRSIRDFTTEHPSLAELGELLFRTCRSRGIFREPERGVDVVDRPYPSGGSMHELDVYVVAPGSPHLERGLWRYAPDRHALDLVTDEEAQVAVLVNDLQQAATLDQPAPFGLLITARFGRLMWKYQTMAYALILKHVGVLYQTFYLNATAMGLGVCGLGGAATSHFATATGISPLAEGVVGGLVAGHPGSVPESPWSTS